jgi:hypothetical protein
MIVGLFHGVDRESTTMAELERRTAEEVVRHLLEDRYGADLVTRVVALARSAVGGGRGLRAGRRGSR